MKTVRWHAGGIAVLALWLVVALLRFQGPPDPAESADGPPPDPPARDLDGTWVVRSVRFEGTEIPAAVAAPITFVFDDGWATMRGGFAAAADGYVPVTGERRYKVAVEFGVLDAQAPAVSATDERYMVVAAARVVAPAGAISLHPADTDRAGCGCVPGLFKIERDRLTLVLNFSGSRPTSLDADAEATARFVCERRITVE